jgi:hypothetical protein
VFARLVASPPPRRFLPRKEVADAGRSAHGAALAPPAAPPPRARRGGGGPAAARVPLAEPGNDHLQPYVRHGIYGYTCRYIRGTSKWSTHAFGIAIDVSSAEEYQGKCSSSVNRYHKHIWEGHKWYWGLAFCDPMHFQYATGY